MRSNSDALRILHVLPNLRVGGAEQMAGYLMAALSEMHVVAALSLYELSDSVIETRLRQAGVSLWHLRKRRGFDPRIIFGIHRVVRELRPDVVHTHLYVLRYVLPALLCCPVPLVVHTVHNQAEHEADAIGRMVHRFAFRRMVVPVAISDDGARSLERVYGVKSGAIIPNCIPVESFRGEPADGARWRRENGFRRDDILFTFVGRLEEQKNPLMLVEAFVSVPDARAHLLVLGDGTLRQRVMELVSSLKLGDRVHLLGKRSDVAQCLAASDVFVLASQWEGNPLAVMEAMASGLPVVSTAVGGVPELIREGQHGILVSPGEPAALAGAMQVLCRDPEMRESMGAAARERACRQFNLQRMVKAYDGLYRSALSQCPTDLGRRGERVLSAERNTQ